MVASKCVRICVASPFLSEKLYEYPLYCAGFLPQRKSRTAYRNYQMPLLHRDLVLGSDHRKKLSFILNHSSQLCFILFNQMITHTVA